MSDYGKLLKKTSKELDKISPTMCFAKWLQVTSHLHLGATHSCHHPVPHKVPIKELILDDTALHNTQQKKRARAQMLKGKRPSECDYCWKIEDSSSKTSSDRILKSSESWALPFVADVLKSGAKKSINPRYMEVSFSNTCNFQCTYCSPQSSSKWQSEIKQHGAYYLKRTSHHNFDPRLHLAVLPESDNLYIETFWNWFPSLYHDLRVFRITGGEPLLSKNTFLVLDFLERNPNPDLELAVNSNLGVPDHLIEKFIQKTKILLEKKCIKKMKVYTSVDTWGKQAEYIRRGMSYSKLFQNIEKVLTALPQENTDVTVMCSYNALSVFSFDKFLQDILRVKSQFCVENESKFVLDISYIRNPEFYSPAVMPQSIMQKMKTDLEFMKERAQRKTQPGFLEYEILKMERLVSYVLSAAVETDENHLKRIWFYEFFMEYDRRGKTNILESFPEIEPFFAEIRKKKEFLDYYESYQYVYSLNE